MPETPKFAVLLTLAALAAPTAACGDDAKNQVDQARKDIRQKADELKGNLDDISNQDLQNALNDAAAPRRSRRHASWSARSSAS